jgi:hypothetical protein
MGEFSRWARLIANPDLPVAVAPQIVIRIGEHPSTGELFSELLNDGPMGLYAGDGP